MMAAPVPYRSESNTQKYTPSFPPPLYYRDTFGLEPVEDQSIENVAEDLRSLESEESKSTIRNQINIFHPNASIPAPAMNRHLSHHLPRRNTGFSALSNCAQDSQNSQQSTIQSMQEELLTTDQVLIIFHAQPFLWISTIFFGVALQLVIFSVVFLFFDGHAFSLAISTILLVNSIILLVFAKYKHTRLMMWLCIFSSVVSLVVSFLLFALATYSIHAEESKVFPNIGLEEMDGTNRIVQNARLFLLCLLLVYSPICAICSGASLYILLCNVQINRKGQIHKGYFLSKTAGHQKVLVPIKLRQIGNINERNVEYGEERNGGGKRRSNAAIQTSVGLGLN